MTRVSIVRNWREKYDPNANFRARRRIVWDGNKTFEPGELIPSGFLSLRKSSAFWRAGWIELATAAQVSASSTPATHSSRFNAPPGWSVASTGGPWYQATAPDGSVHKRRGKAAMRSFLRSLSEQVLEG